MRTIGIGLMVGVAALFLVGCGDDGGSSGVASHDTGAECPAEGTPLTYANFGQAFMAQHCTLCHSADAPGGPSGGHDFTDQSHIREHAEHIIEVAGAGPLSINRAMPPAGSGGTVTDESRTKLTEWLICGAP